MSMLRVKSLVAFTYFASRSLYQYFKYVPILRIIRLYALQSTTLAYQHNSWPDIFHSTARRRRGRRGGVIDDGAFKVSGHERSNQQTVVLREMMHLTSLKTLKITNTVPTHLLAGRLPLEELIGGVVGEHGLRDVVECGEPLLPRVVRHGQRHDVAPPAVRPRP